MLKVKHVPEQLLDVTITPVMFVLMFTYLFGGAIAGSTGEYLDYILPGILVMSVLFTTVYSGVALNTDLTKGVVDRFRSLPIWRAGAAGRSAARRQRALPGRRHGDHRPRADPRLPAGGGVRGVLAALALVVLFAFGLSWVFTTLGPAPALAERGDERGLHGHLPAHVPLQRLRRAGDAAGAGSRRSSNVNPISILATASRGLMEGNADGGDIAIVLAVAAALTAVFAPLTTRLYRTKG